jgi:hypothetical protein
VHHSTRNASRLAALSPRTYCAVTHRLSRKIRPRQRATRDRHRTRMGQENDTTSMGTFFDVWKIRGDKRHELDQNRVSQQHTHKVHARTRAMYAVLDQLPAETRSNSYFDKDLIAQIDQPTRNIEVRLAHAEPLVQATRTLRSSTDSGNGTSRHSRVLPSVGFHTRP